jgi:3-oxoacyl-[acyl-carrier protein] reductase
MDLGIRNKTALVLGAGGGLGGAIAAALAREGAKLAIADIDGNSLERTGTKLSAVGASVRPFVWNIEEAASDRSRIEEILSATGGIDILVNNTGGPPPSLVSGVPAETWNKYFRSMVLSVIAITDAVLPSMRARKWGRIITSASSGIIAPIPNLGLSNALRASLMGWSKTLAREVAADGITSNLIIPGRIATQRIQQLDEKAAEREGRSVEEVRAASLASIPMRRYGTPEEYADATVFLASERASYITGSIIRVDGGYIPSI